MLPRLLAKKSLSAVPRSLFLRGLATDIKPIQNVTVYGSGIYKRGKNTVLL